MAPSTLPRSGWTLADVQDLGKALHRCDYCENEHVRYVHTLTHDEAASIRVGCVCAEKLTGDEKTPKEREDVLRGRAKRMLTWLDWRMWTTTDDEHRRRGRQLHWDFEFIAYRAADGWRWKIIIPTMGTYHGPHAYDDAEAAKQHFWLRRIEKVERDQEPEPIDL